MSAGASKEVALFGASGTIGRATAAALIEAGHNVTCVMRKPFTTAPPPLAKARYHYAEITGTHCDLEALFQNHSFDAVISCIASRSGEPDDAWLVDYAANLKILSAAKALDIKQFILLSAICVQKPMLEFQHAKLAFESALIRSGIAYSIVRPTAFFKSLSGQIDRVRRGKPFLVFGNGKLTSCKPISDSDLARYIADCLHDPARRGAILPIGGPGPAITPLEQAHMLFDLTGRKPHFRTIPVGAMDALIAALNIAGKLSKRAAAKAEYARIGRYYATESMLVMNPATGEYDSTATPETGQQTLQEHYYKAIS
ncbi:NAD(P)H-binding protein [Pontixanthobacter sp.]|uniref:NAD(P)H-binding protein n=1 Tax=Pontixanthobacter sp. TaxID=2792078 RepID=UPI003C7DA684